MTTDSTSPDARINSISDEILNYDLVVPQLIPGYTSLARLAVALLAASPMAAKAGSKVLVAGCGTGAELLEARAQRPDWQLTAIDPSAEMLAIAQTRLSDSSRVFWHCGTVETLQTKTQFDGALAVLVLQSLADDGTKLAFLTSLAGSLQPGGQLVLVDLMRPERSPLQDQVGRAWQAFQLASGLTSLPEVTQLTDQRVLHPIGLGRLTALVEAAGFSDPAPVFKALDFEGFLLQRAA